MSNARTEFENWFKGKFFWEPKRVDDDYVGTTAASAWAGWQARGQAEPLTDERICEIAKIRWANAEAALSKQEAATPATELLRLFDLYAANLLQGANAQAACTRDAFRAALNYSPVAATPQSPAAQPEAREALRELWQALNDLSFECDGVTRTAAPSRETYNRTFAVMEKYRAALSQGAAK